MKPKALAFLAAVSTATALAACGSSDAKTYDISPIFPLSSGKCAKYGGTQQGTGITASCLVTKSECLRASSDWRKAMQSSGVDDAIEFSCN